MLKKEDIKQIQEKGIDVKVVEKQIEYFKKGFPFAELTKPAIVNDGIQIIGEIELERLAKKYIDCIKERNILKFVPASGAATRMFKSLFEFREKYKGTEDDYEAYLRDTSYNSVYKFIAKIKNFAFYNDLKNILAENDYSIDKCISDRNFNLIIDFLLKKGGLHYSELPKGLLMFHDYKTHVRTPVEEHLVEGANYCKGKGNNVNIHFTVSYAHKKRFIELIKNVINRYEESYKARFTIDFSEQKHTTDTIAVDVNNEPFRDKDGTLVFRPGGHGALLENLNDLKGDIIFIKNIDNVLPDRFTAETYLYKKALGGLLIELQDKIFACLNILDKPNIEEKTLDEIKLFASTKLCIIINDSYEKLNIKDKQKYLFDKLNRPIRICGMVKNEGEPGGGPFWVKNSKGVESLQIVESSQIDMNNKSQLEIFKSSTHFNPVDLVCGVKDYKGNNFNLLNFVDPLTGFISIKSKDGRDLKALELPGLWNGAMADWITIFVEVPLITFNPVKTVNDLLRKEHQAVL